MTNPIRIFLVDDHPIVRSALSSVFEDEPDLELCGEAATATDALEHALAARPDLVLVDVSLPDMSGIQLVRRLLEQNDDLRIAMLSGHAEKSHVQQSLQARALGYILKGNTDQLLEGIRAVARGERYVSAELRPD